MADITDWSSPISKVRALIPDTEKIYHSADPDGPDEFILSDQHILALLTLNGYDPDIPDSYTIGQVRRTAADCCAVIGTSEVLILKVITSEDLTTDGAKSGNYFLVRAQQLRLEAVAEDELLWDSFDIVPFVLYPVQDEWR